MSAAARPSKQIAALMTQPDIKERSRLVWQHRVGRQIGFDEYA